MDKTSCTVCVTGGAGYVASSLIKKLLNEGYTVHTTLRNLNDSTKVDPLKSFNGAKESLKLFEANIYRAEEFEQAIQGCEFVFHVATPFLHTQGQKHKDRVDATLDAARTIAAICVKLGTVRRLIYTASVMAASPLKEDGSGYKDIMDETCWTPLNLNIPYCNDFFKEYTSAKTLAEKEILSFNNVDGSGGMEVVTLALGLVGGETPMPWIAPSMAMCLSHLTDNEFEYELLKFLEYLLAKVPMVHIEDVCDAHIFCMKEESMSGRFVCANAYISTADIVNYYKEKYPEYNVKKEYYDGPNKETKFECSLLKGRGFEYKYDWPLVLDGCINSARENGYL